MFQSNQFSFLKGACDKNQLRWSFNQQLETCTPFIFGGCGGNENNFESQEECVSGLRNFQLSIYLSLIKNVHYFFQLALKILR